MLLACSGIPYFIINDDRATQSQIDKEVLCMSDHSRSEYFVTFTAGENPKYGSEL